MRISNCVLALGLVLAGAIPAGAQPPEAPMISGVVREVHMAGTYVYLRIAQDTEGGAELWLAGPRTEIRVGERVHAPEGARMENFHSRQLDRQFEVIHLVSALRVEGRAAPPPPSLAEVHSGHGKSEGSAPTVSDVHPIEGGLRVGQIFAQREALAGSEVLVRARVMKVTEKVMGKNWLHLQDGSVGPGGENDLTVSTEDRAKVGDLVLVRGTVVLDRDFGYGYRYDLLIEASALSVE